MTSNLQKTQRFRELVSLYLGGRGISQTMKPYYSKLYKFLEDENTDRGDIRGVPGWSIHVRNEVHRDLSGAADYAVRIAAEGGKPKAATVWHRPGRPASESYVLMTLEHFARVLEDAPTMQMKDRVPSEEPLGL